MSTAERAPLSSFRIQKKAEHSQMRRRTACRLSSSAKMFGTVSYKKSLVSICDFLFDGRQQGFENLDALLVEQRKFPQLIHVA